MAWLKRPWFIALVLLAGVLAALVWARSRGVPAEVQRVAAAPLVQSMVVSGRVASVNRVFVGATVTGRVAEVTRREGGTLAAGELLVRLEDAELVATLRQAEAVQRGAEARLLSQQRLAAPVATQQLEQARANAGAAERELQRSRELLGQGFIGQARLDEAQRAAEVARAQLAAAQAQREANVGGGAELAQTEARLAEARAAAELARARLAQTRVLAPAAATVLARLAEPGQIVQPGTRLAELGVSGPVQLVAQVDEKYLAQLSPGLVASVVADAYPGQPFEARVISLSPLVDAQRGALEVKFGLTAPPPWLRNDMTVSIEVVTGRRERALVVPGEALRPGPSVLVAEGGRAVSRPIKTGLRTLAVVEVTEGLREGDSVIVDSAIGAGARVRPLPGASGNAVGAGVTDAVRNMGN